MEMINRGEMKMKQYMFNNASAQMKSTLYDKEKIPISTFSD